MICFFCYARGEITTDAVMVIQGNSVCNMEAHMKAGVLGLADGITYLNEKYGEV